MWWKTEERENSLIPEGTYTATLVDCKLDTTKELVRMTLEWELENKRKTWQNFNFGDKQAKFLSWQLGVLGVWQLGRECDTQEEMINKVFDGVVKILNRTAATLEITHREYQGKTYLNVIIKDAVLPQMSVTDVPMPDMSEDLIPF